MAVFTPVPKEQLEEFLLSYDLGKLVSYEGIQQGVSNTNYHLYTDIGHYILTLFEPQRVLEEELSTFLEYSDHLNSKGIPTPSVIADKDGNRSNTLCDRPTAIFEFLEGEGGFSEMISPEICYQVGGLNANMHVAVTDLACTKANNFASKRWLEWITDISDKFEQIQSGLTAEIDEAYQNITAQWPADLPCGAIHADLFPDNVFFQQNKICGVIDFHFVCADYFAYDLAITINAWCFDCNNNFILERYEQILNGYQNIRSLSDTEKAAMPILLQGVALRFFLSRTEELFNHSSDQLMTPKDPIEFLDRLRFFQSFK